MRNLLIVAIALFTLNGMAQEKRNKHERLKDRMELRKDMTPNEIADLKNKKHGTAIRSH